MKPRKCSRRVGHRLGPGRVRRVDVEHAGADLEVPVVEELVELADVALVLRAAELDRGHVDAGIGPERHDVAEVAVAHVRVHLDARRLVEDVVEGGAHAAGVDRAPLARRRRSAAASARGPPARRSARPAPRPRPAPDLGCDRLGDRPEEPIVRHARRAEAPVHDRDRPGEHALHRPAGWRPGRRATRGPSSARAPPAARPGSAGGCMRLP